MRVVEIRYTLRVITVSIYKYIQPPADHTAHSRETCQSSISGPISSQESFHIHVYITIVGIFLQDQAYICIA